MEAPQRTAQNRGRDPRKRRSPEEKLGRRKWIIRTLKRQDAVLKRIDRRTRMMAAGLRDLLILPEDYVSMVACKDEVDAAILGALREAGSKGKQTGELAAELGINHRDVSRRIYAMNKRMRDEMEEAIILKYDGKWRLVKKLRRDFADAKQEEEDFE